jgi:hypothetical protein
MSRISGKKKHPLEVDDSVMNKSLMFSDATRNILAPSVQYCFEHIVT